MSLMNKVATFPERIAQACAILLTALYLVTGLAYLCLDHWSVTQQDFWRIYDICLNHSWMHTAVNKYNSHSLFFPSFVFLADLSFFHGNQAVVFYVSLAILVISTGLLLLPIWHDKALDLTTKTLAALTIIGVSFWMGRASITVSGGFDCIASFVMLGLAGSLLLLPKMESPLSQCWQRTALIVFAGYISSFSFATGLAIWPCLLFLGWCLRLSWRSLSVIAVAGVSAGLIFHFLPPHEAPSELIPAGASIGPLCLEALRDFTRLLGAPVLYCATSWQGIQITTEMTQSSAWLLWSGAAGLLLGIALPITYLIRRDLQGKTLELAGLGLILFNLASLFLVVAGRLEYFREIPGEIAAPRHWFWSSLFWAGLLLVALGIGTRRRWIRWPSVVLVLTAPIIGWPGHREEGIHWRYARFLSEQSATGLINGVRDPHEGPSIDMQQIDLLTRQLRARRLDMFAAGIQDWIGQPIATLFGGRREKNHFGGQAHVERIPNSLNRDDSVRVVGRIFLSKHTPPSTMVILDSRGMVVGIARSFVTGKYLNWLLFGNRLSNAPLCGYIRQYHPDAQYSIRSVQNRRISDQEIRIEGVASEKLRLHPGKGAARSRTFAEFVGPPANRRRPKSSLFNAAGTAIATNDDWQSDPGASQVEAEGLAPSDPVESATIQTLAPGAYTFVVAAKGLMPGIGLVEAYDLSPLANSKLANLITRGAVGTGDDVKRSDTYHFR
jgi:hypothetical protein